MADQVKFQRGKKTNLPTDKVAGTFYITTDTGEMFTDVLNGSAVDRVTIKTPSVGTVSFKQGSETVATYDGSGSVDVNLPEEQDSVLYTSQTLTEAQQTQARDNIGASSINASVNDETLVINGYGGSGGGSGGSGGGTSITIDSALSTTSTNPVQNKVITTTINNLAKIQIVDNLPSTLTNNTVYFVY